MRVMRAELLLINMASIILLAKLAEDLSARAGLPPFVGPMLLGTAIGRFLPLGDFYFLASLGAVFLIFFAGVEEVGEVKANGKILLKGILMFVVPFVSITMVLGINREALQVASILSMVGAGVLVKLLAEMGIGREGSEVLMSSIVAEAIGLLIFSYIEKGVQNLILGSILVITILKVGEKTFKYFMEREEMMFAREFPLAFVFSMLIIISMTSEAVGVASVLSALLLGVLTSDYLIERPWLLKKLKTVNEFFFEPFFFFTIGSRMAISFNIMIPVLAAVALLTRFAISYILFKDKRIAIAMLAKGGADSSLLLKAKIGPSLYTSTFSVIMLGAIIPSILGGKIRLKEAYVCQLPLDVAYVKLNDKLRKAFELLKAGRDGVVVVDDELRPIGFISPSHLLGLKEELMDELEVWEAYQHGVPVITCRVSIRRLSEIKDELLHYPVIAVVEGGKFRGSIQQRDLIGISKSSPHS